MKEKFIRLVFSADKGDTLITRYVKIDRGISMKDQQYIELMSIQKKFPDAVLIVCCISDILCIDHNERRMKI